MPLSIVRTCCRCGQEFPTQNSTRRRLVCNACRKPEFPSQLSFRERQIVALIAKAHSNKDIAFQLKLSEGTIKEYVNRIFRKLDVGSRTELAIWAVTVGKEKVEE